MKKTSQILPAPTNKSRARDIMDTMPYKELVKYGFKKWATTNSMLIENGEKPAPKNYDVILIPASWYNVLYNGLVFYDIFGQKEVFKKGVSDDDNRFGCLPYGILRPVKK